MKKFITIILTMIMTLGVLSAWGSVAAASSEPQVVLEDAHVTIFCAYAGENPHGQYVYKYADSFMEKYPNVTIEIIAVRSTDIYTKFAAVANTSDIPTMCYTSADGAASYASLGVVEDWKNYLDDDYLSGFASNVVDGCILNDSMCIFPIDIQPQAVLYRVDHFEEAGLSVPTTWQEFLDCAIALTGNVNGEERWGFSMVGANNGSGQGRFNYYLWSRGFELAYLEDGKWVTDMDSQEFLDAFTYWTDLNNVHKVVPVGVTEATYDTAANYFAMGITSMMISGGNALGVAYSVNPELQGKVGSFVLPGDHPGSMLGAEGYFVTKASGEAEKKAAAEFCKYFVINDPEMSFWQTSGKLPPTTSSLESSYLQGEDYAGFINTTKNVRPIASFPGIVALRGLLGDAYSTVFSGEMTNEQAVAKLLVEVEELLEEYN